MPIDLRNPERYGLYQLFWNTHDDEDLPGGGLNELSRSGADKLHAYALSHELDGTPSADGQRKIDTEEKDFIKALLNDDQYIGGGARAYFELDARVHLMELFEISRDEVRADVMRPVDHGQIALPENRISVIPVERLSNADIRALPDLFVREYERNRARFEGGAGTREEKSLEVLGLLRDYAEALWSSGERSETKVVGNALLDAFERTRYGNVLGSLGYNGAPWGVAQGLVLHLDPNAFETSFPEAGSKVDATYLNMSDAMAKPMSFVDEYRAALGLEKGAEALERRSPLGFMIGQPNGHNKKGSLEEQRPFATSGLNWGVVLFPGDRQIAELPPKEGFEIPIDCVDSLNNFVRCDPRQGESLKVIDKDGNFLTVEKKIHEQDGKPVSWTAELVGANGAVVPPNEALGVIVDARGRIKGDKKAKNSVNMWWWGFCDRNTAQKLYKAKFGIPQLDMDVVKVKAGDRVVEVPTAEAQKLLDSDVPDIVGRETMCGFRFNDEPQQIQLKDGQVLEGRVRGGVMDSAPGMSLLGDDVRVIHNDEKRPLLGMLKLEIDGRTDEILVKNIEKLEKDPLTGTVTLQVKDGQQARLEGKLATEISWDGAVNVDGKLVITQDETFPVRGFLEVDLADGRTEAIEARSVNQIVGEIKSEHHLAQFLTWVSQQKGMYATDSSTGEVVSNGMRWTNAIEADVRIDGVRPDWAPQGDLKGAEGPLDEANGSKLVWVRGLYAYDAGAEANSTGFAGWIQLSKHGRIVNEGFTQGEPDFGWSAEGPLNWLAKSSFNSYVVPEMRLAMLVNGVKDLKSDTDKTDALAAKLDLPANWRSYRTA